MLKQYVMYGIQGANRNYRVSGYKLLTVDTDRDPIKFIKRMAFRFSIETDLNSIYLIESDKITAEDYREAIKANSIEGYICFKAILETEGLRIF